MKDTAIIVADTQGVICSCDEAAQALLGYSKREAVGQSLELIIPAPYRERHRSGYRAAIERGNTKADQPAARLPMLCKDGSVKFCAGRQVFLRDAYGRAVGVAAVFTSGSAPANAPQLFQMPWPL